MAELRFTGGASSTMAHKNNPIAAAGPEMIMEWASPPPLMTLAAGALDTLAECLDTMSVDTDRMAANATNLPDGRLVDDSALIDRLIDS